MLDKVLEERGKQYGTFAKHAEISQTLKSWCRQFVGETQTHLLPDQMEALDMILHKIARIVNGNPNYVDSWTDIAGYATLVANRLEKDHAAKSIR